MRYTNYSCFKRDNSFFGGVVCTYRRKKSSEHYIVFIDHFVKMSDISFFLHKFNEEKNDLARITISLKPGIWGKVL